MISRCHSKKIITNFTYIKTKEDLAKKSPNYYCTEYSPLLIQLDSLLMKTSAQSPKPHIYFFKGQNISEIPEVTTQNHQF